MDIQNRNNNEATNKALAQELLQHIRTASLGGAEKQRERHISRGKLLARDRIDKLIDPNTPFLELSALAANGQYSDDFPSAGIVTGIGLIHGREDDCPTMLSKCTKQYETIMKHLRAQEIAEKSSPISFMVDSGGIFLPECQRVFLTKTILVVYSTIKHVCFCWLPQIAIVMGLHRRRCLCSC